MINSVFSHKVNRQIFWLFWGVTFVIIIELLQVVYGFSGRIAAVDGLVTIGLIILSIALISQSVLTKEGASYKIFPLLIIILLATAACGGIDYYILEAIYRDQPVYTSFLRASLPFRIFLIWILICAFVFMNFLWNRASAQNSLQTRKDALEKMAKEAELNKIYRQFQPHFIFNCLNTIQVLIETQPEQAEKTVQNLSDFLRGSIQRKQEDRIVLAAEMEHLALYLAIEKIRFGDRLISQIDVTERAESMQLPPLILQPLIENAIKFGLYGTVDQVKIQCVVSDKDENLKIKITNPFDEDAQPPKGTGYGLHSVQRRLYLIFGRQDLLQTTTENHIFTVQLTIPQYYDKSTRN